MSLAFYQAWNFFFALLFYNRQHTEISKRFTLFLIALQHQITGPDISTCEYQNGITRLLAAKETEHSALTYQSLHFSDYTGVCQKLHHQQYKQAGFLWFLTDF